MLSSSTIEIYLLLGFLAGLDQSKPPWIVVMTVPIETISLYLFTEAKRRRQRDIGGIGKSIDKMMFDELSIPMSSTMSTSLKKMAVSLCQSDDIITDLNWGQANLLKGAR